MTDFLDEKRKEITRRLCELKPMVDEYRRLDAAASALAGVGGSTSAGATTTVAPRRGSSNRRGTAAASTAARAKATRKEVGRGPGRSAGRRKGSGQRGAEALALIQGQPGIAIPEIATKMGIKQNYLYRGATTNA